VCPSGLFSFSGAVLAVDLFAFPTRRSSDLGPAGPARPPRPAARPRAAARPGSGRARARAGRPLRKSPRPPAAAAGPAAAGTTRRSEEHTSELQSREKLVCRLLLEIKK